MKKLLFVLLFFIFINNVTAIEDIRIDNNDLIPKFSKEFKVYNYYTNNSKITVYTKGKQNEIIINNKNYALKDGLNKIIISSSNGEEYRINVFKNYRKDNDEDVFLEDLRILNYEIDFDRDRLEYFVNIGEESNLDIEYELSNSSAYVSVEGNGNFNKTDNIIKINVNNQKEYIIHVYKSMKASKIERIEEFKELSPIKKEVVSIFLITISCVLILLFHYSLFINKTTLHI